MAETAFSSGYVQARQRARQTLVIKNRCSYQSQKHLITTTLKKASQTNTVKIRGGMTNTRKYDSAVELAVFFHNDTIKERKQERKKERKKEKKKERKKEKNKERKKERKK